MLETFKQQAVKGLVNSLPTVLIALIFAFGFVETQFTRYVDEVATVAAQEVINDYKVEQAVAQLKKETDKLSNGKPDFVQRVNVETVLAHETKIRTNYPELVPRLDRLIEFYKQTFIG